MANYIRIIILVFLCFRLSGQDTETTSAFDVNSAQPIDTRLLLVTLADTSTIDYPYEGLRTYIKSELSYYEYKQGKWTKTLTIPAIGDVFINGRVSASDPTSGSHLTTKDWVVQNFSSHEETTRIYTSEIYNLQNGEPPTWMGDMKYDDLYFDLSNDRWFIWRNGFVGDEWQEIIDKTLTKTATDGSGNLMVSFEAAVEVPKERLDIGGAVLLGPNSNENEGTVRYDTLTMKFQGRTPSGWEVLNGGELPPTFDYLDFTNNIGDQSYLEGRIYYDTTNHTLTFFDDEAESSLQIGQEQRVRVYNGNGSTITNGYAVSVTGLTSDGVLEVGLAIASDKESALNTIGIATHDIEAGTYGWATTHGIVRGVNTSSLTGGAAIYLSDSIAGWYTTERPPSPSYEVRMGGVVQQDATEGQLYAELRIITNTHDNFNFFTGAILEYNSATITSSGGVVTSVLTNTEGGDSINLIFDDGYLRVESGISVNLTLGTDSAPVENFVYITDAGVMTTSTSSFPLSGDYVPVGRYVVGSAARAESYGVYKSHAYTDHLRGGSNGHLSHINEWIRSRPAEWQSGVVLTTSAAVSVATDTIDLSFTSGVVSQLHNQTFPAFDTETDASFVVNDFATPYEIIEGITPSIDTDSEGNAIGNNKYYNIVVWGVASQESKDCKIFYNLPSGSYTSEADALNDIDDYTSFSIPSEYTGTGFLISKLTIQRTNTTVEIIDITDLRGSIPISGGGATAGGQGISSFDELTDSPASKAGAAGYHVKVNDTENALEYVAPETNFYDDNDTLSDNRTVYMDSKGLTLLNGSGFILQGVDVIHTGDYTLTGSTEYPFFIGGNYSGMMELSRSGFTGADIKLSNFSDSWVFGMDDNEGFFIKDNDASNTSLYIPNGGAAVGIGTTTPEVELNVEWTGASGGARFKRTDFGTNGSDVFLNGSGGDPQIRFNRDGDSWAIGNDGGKFAIDDNANLGTNNRLTIDASGNVGIGTSTPSAKFHITGGTSSDQFRVGHGAIVEYRIGRNTTTGFLDFQGDQAGYTGYHFKSDDGSTLVNIIDNGNVGIGTTSPSSILEISAVDPEFHIDGTSSSNIHFQASGVQKWNLTRRPTTNDLWFYNNTGTNSTNLAIEHSTGNVGIGTSTPSAGLEVLDDTGFDKDLVSLKSGYSETVFNSYGGIYTKHSSDKYWGIEQKGGGAGYRLEIGYDTLESTFHTQSADPFLTIDTSGNVGIGTTSPTQKLDVVGTVEADAFTINGTPVGTSTSSYWNQNGSDINFTSGNVGIGTTSPTELLEVSGNVLSTSAESQGLKHISTGNRGGLYLQGAGYNEDALVMTMRNDITDVVYSVYDDSESLFKPFIKYKYEIDELELNDADLVIDSLGNVGIGTTSPSAKLQIGNYADGTGDATYGGFLKFSEQNTSLNEDGGIEWKIAGDNYGGKIDVISSLGANMVFGLRNNSAGWAEVMRINPAGNVGIGTTNPIEKLHVSKDNTVILLDDVDTALSDGEQQGAIYFRSSDTGGAGINAGIKVEGDGSSGYGTMKFLTGQANTVNPRLTIDGTSGNVGIGTTSPTNKLTVNEDISEVATVGVFSTSENVDIKLGQGAVNNLTTRWVYNSTPANAYAWIVSDTYNNDIRIDAADLLLQTAQVAAKVGIGTTTPSEKLHVQNGSIRIKATDQTNRVMQFENDSGSKFEIMSVRSNSGGSRANDLRVYSYDATKDFIVENFNAVGIGTDGPQEKLDVVGNARIRSIGSGTSSGALHYEADGTLTTNTSDRRLKKNIVEVNDSIALKKLLELKPSEFNWKKSKKVMRDSSFINERKQNIIELTMQIDSLEGANTGSGTSIPNQIKELTQQRKTAKEELKQYRKINKKRKENTDRTNIGFIAQDVRKVLPSAVGKNDDGYLFLRDEQIGAITVSAIKEQQRQIEEQKQLIQQLLQRIEALENE